MKINPRIVIASVVGLSMVGGSWLLAQSKAEDAADELLIKSTVNNVPAHGYIPVKDEDDDGLPDWQNTFNISTINMDEAPVQTLTETGAFAAELAVRTYIDNAEPAEILSGLSTDLARHTLDEGYTPSDIIVSGEDSELTRKAYGNRVAIVAFDNAPPPGTKSELEVLNSALLRDDPSILAELDPTIKSYEGMIADMLASPVPPSLVREHLSLINVYQALMNDIKAFQGTFDDALPAMARFRRYQADVEALYTALAMLYQKLHQEGIQWNENDPASKFINIE